MRSRSFFGDLLQVLLFAVAGALAGLTVGFVLSVRFVARLDLSAGALVRVEDAGVASLVSSLFSGLGGTVLSILVLVLALITVAVAMLLAVRGAERKGRALAFVLGGAFLGAALSAAAIPFISSFGRAETAMGAAGLGGAVLARFLVWPRLVVPVLIGAVIGWVAGAAAANSWGRRIALFFPSLLVLGGAIVVLITIRPPILTLPSNVPELATGTEGEEMTVYVIGGNDQAVPVTISLKAYTARNPGAAPLVVDRRNVSKALKVATLLPKIHPRSTAAEQLLVAGSLSELDVEKAAKRLLQNFEHRGNPMDGELAAEMIGRLSPTPEAIKLLKHAADPARFTAGQAAAKSLCPLARDSGLADVSARLKCPGKAAKAATSKVHGKLFLKGRPLRRTPVGLVAEPAGIDAAWVKKGQINAAALQLVAGARTDAQGAVTFDHVVPGTYLLAVAPRKLMQDAKALKLAAAVRVAVPEKGGEVALGDIQAGDTGPIKRPPPSHGVGISADAVAEGFEAEPPATEPGAEGEGEGEDLAQAEPQGDTGPTAVRPVPPQRTPPVSREAKRLISKIRPEGPDRVVVPAGFGTKLLETKQSILDPTATISPARDTAGRSTGLELRGLGANGVPVALGFLDGDIVQSVNGRPLREPDDVVELVDVLEGVSSVRVKIKRGGRLKTIRIDVEE